MKVKLSENETDSDIRVDLNGNSIGWASFNFEDDLFFKLMISLTADQMIAVANALKADKR